jgi:hypothetical protein
MLSDVTSMSWVVMKQLLNTVFSLIIIVLPFKYKYDIHFRFNPFHTLYERGYLSKSSYLCSLKSDEKCISFFNSM